MCNENCSIKMMILFIILYILEVQSSRRLNSEATMIPTLWNVTEVVQREFGLWFIVVNNNSRLERYPIKESDVGLFCTVKPQRKYDFEVDAIPLAQTEQLVMGSPAVYNDGPNNLIHTLIRQPEQPVVEERRVRFSLQNMGE